MAQARKQQLTTVSRGVETYFPEETVKTDMSSSKLHTPPEPLEVKHPERNAQGRECHIRAPIERSQQKMKVEPGHCTCQQPLETGSPSANSNDLSASHPSRGVKSAVTPMSPMDDTESLGGSMCHARLGQDVKGGLTKASAQQQDVHNEGRELMPMPEEQGEEMLCQGCKRATIQATDRHAGDVDVAEHGRLSKAATTGAQGGAIQTCPIASVVVIQVTMDNHGLHAGLFREQDGNGGDDQWDTALKSRGSPYPGSVLPQLPAGHQALPVSLPADPPKAGDNLSMYACPSYSSLCLQGDFYSMQNAKASCMLLELPTGATPKIPSISNSRSKK